jgi:hypothetical protein
MPTVYEAEAVIEAVCEAVLEPYDGDDFNDLDNETLFTIALGCFAVARRAAVTALKSDDDARLWFQHIIADRWRPDPP